MAMSQSESQINSSRSSLKQIQLSSFYGDKGALGVYANKRKSLNPQEELNITKDYNKKVNRFNCQENLPDSSNQLKASSMKNPTFKKTQTVTQVTYIQPNNLLQELTLASVQRPQLKNIANANTDNLKQLFRSTEKQELTSRDCKINYQSVDYKWKPCVRKINLKDSLSNEHFDRRQLKTVRDQLNSSSIFNQTDNIPTKASNRVSSPLSSFASNTESKKLIEYDYGAEMRRDNAPLTKKCNEVIPEGFQEGKLVQQHNKKKSPFQMECVILRGK